MKPIPTASLYLRKEKIHFASFSVILDLSMGVPRLPKQFSLWFIMRSDCVVYVTDMLTAC